MKHGKTGIVWSWIFAAFVLFFLYLPLTAPHVPLHPSVDFAGSSARDLYGDSVEEIDFHVGRILDKLTELGIDSNTLVFFASDNGPIQIKVYRSDEGPPQIERMHIAWRGEGEQPGVHGIGSEEQHHHGHHAEGDAEREGLAFRDPARRDRPVGFVDRIHVAIEPVIDHLAGPTDQWPGKENADQGKPPMLADRLAGRDDTAQECPHRRKPGDWFEQFEQGRRRGKPSRRQEGRCGLHGV